MARRLPPGTRQYETHRQLIARASSRPARASAGVLDAIIVPASRPAANLDHAVTLARAARCSLVVLCSRGARAADVNELLASRCFDFDQAIIVDLPDGYTHPLLDFATSRFTAADLPRACVNPNTDLSTKRNLGLVLARMLGWKRVFFMDDDIRDLDSADLHSAVSMLGPYRSVGMRATDFPDNSVVCHAHRETGGVQDVFVSGSVLAVHCDAHVAFFPEVYNEDWLFFYPDAAAGRLGWSGRDATQLRYDPFADPQRAAGQEFGDLLAEGLYALLHIGGDAADATKEYWKLFLDARMSFLDAVIDRSEKAEHTLRERMTVSVEAARSCSRQVQPLVCEQFVGLWKSDLCAWERRFQEIPRLTSVATALRELSLMSGGADVPTVRRDAGQMEKNVMPGRVRIPEITTLQGMSGKMSLAALRNSGSVMSGDPAVAATSAPQREGGHRRIRGRFTRRTRVARVARVGTMQWVSLASLAAVLGARSRGGSGGTAGGRNWREL